MDTTSEFNELHTKYNQIEEKLHILQGQYQLLSEDHRELRTQYARLSTQTMRLQSHVSQHVIHQTQTFIDQQLRDTTNTLSQSRLRELLPANDTNPCYTWITPNMAIGSSESDYSPFDCIVNLNFQGELLALGNTLRHHDIRTTISDTQKQITQVAIYDHPSEKECMKRALHSIIPLLVQRVRQLPNLKILFHCYAGVSRSGSLGVAYLALMESRPYDIALHRVKEMRPEVNPNAGFVEAITEFLSEINSIQNMVIV